ncbi:ScaI family restriction endonuclease [Methyloradius palustris]|uniref:Restriction endonuclease n=1 Tax=Methyloradius palustris TaxID=2778876 RepID=A0A8D5JX30_9PROT|nr:ScaI family restriction endonuclease [Methyloradius palustris]BCM25724.1 hypothetical protein ZMTM_19830 [Methyloradius palustris]
MSPYATASIDQWPDITNQLISDHPLHPAEILDIAQVCWESVWETQIGSGSTIINLIEISPPATVIGYFFEKLFAKELARRYPAEWRGGVTGNDKDLVCIADNQKSIEIKASGQLGLKIYGNRSYGQEAENAHLVKKDKSGYYITVNFYANVLTLVRFGWIDASDWQAQKAATGQMAGLNPNVYEYKLLPLKGRYALNAPIGLLSGIGPKLSGELQAIGIRRVIDLIQYDGEANKSLLKAQKIALTYEDLFAKEFTEAFDEPQPPPTLVADQ